MVRMRNVNTTDIRDAIRLGCRTMSSVFNADDDDIPFFDSQVRPTAYLAFHPALSEAHVPGRHLNALLNAEDAAGIEIDEDAVNKHARAAFFSYSGPVTLPMNRDRIGGRLVNCDLHNIREGFHALYALAHFRQSDRARKLAQSSIETIFKLWDPIKGWDFAALNKMVGKEVGRWPSLIMELARAIGPLVKYYRATGYSPALELAIVVKNKVTAECFTEQGSYDHKLFGGHTHSVTCVMSSLAQLADLTADSNLMNRVRAFYDNGLWQMRDQIGWAIERTNIEIHPDPNPDRGEANSTGDIVETALILGRWGYTHYYEDAERILRCHLLPSQLRDVSFIQDPPNPDREDGKRDVANRHLGAFGFPAPYGHEPIGAGSVHFCMDIVGGAVGSLCEACREICRSDQAGHWVNLLFDHETPSLAVQSPYTHDCLQVLVKRPGPLFVRIPSWADRKQITIQGTTETPRWSNGYLFLASLPLNRWITIAFALPEREITLKHRTRQIRVRLRGDEVSAMENFGADLTFFPPL